MALSRCGASDGLCCARERCRTLPIPNRKVAVNSSSLGSLTHASRADRKGSIDLTGYVVELLEDARLLKQLHREGELCLFQVRACLPRSCLRDHILLSAWLRWLQLSHPDPSKRVWILAAESEADLVEWCGLCSNLVVFR